MTQIKKDKETLEHVVFIERFAIASDLSQLVQD